MKEVNKFSSETFPINQNQLEEEDKTKKGAEDFETALAFFKAQLFKPKGRHALNYLMEKRGYSQEEIEAMELGFFPFKKEAKKHLGDLLESLGLNVKGLGKTHKIVIPYRDPEGKIKGFIVRRLDSERPKYVYTKETDRDTFFNLHQARTEKKLIVVEGYFDALIATQRGVKGIVAIGFSRVTEKMLEDTITHGVKSITLVPDNDVVGLKGAEKSLELIRENGLEALVLELPDKFKDLDEFIRKQGIKAFQRLRAQAKSSEKWDAQKLLSKHLNIKVQIKSANNTSVAQVYYIRKGNEPVQKENNS
jgi:DNA primase